MDQVRLEEEEDYYSKWLKEDVVYIISAEERTVFESLTTPEEKEQFIEQFWHRRDTDMNTAANEFREEHYRRIAYTNENFTSGQPGWKTDRGRIYILHGPPNEIVAKPTGGAYLRPDNEGGGATSTYPFETWKYNYIEGIGTDVELEFVDPTYSGEFRLSRDRWEKDILLNVPGTGLTQAEELGITERAYHPAFNEFSNQIRLSYPMMHPRMKDDPFVRYETYSMMQRPIPVKYKDFKELVTVNLSFSTLPVEVRTDYFRLNENQVVTPITVSLKNHLLSFNLEEGIHRAQVAVYGIISDMGNRIVQEFEDDIRISYRPEDFEKGLTRLSLYQKIVYLDSRTKYKLDLVVKDLNSGNVGVTRAGLIPPKFADGELSASSLVLSDLLQPLESMPETEQMFVLGDVRVIPNTVGEFRQRKQPLGVYMQVYNIGVDQATLLPSLRVSYALVRNGKTLAEVVDEEGQTIHFFSGQRIVLLKTLSLERLEPGNYRILVSVQDLLSQKSIQKGENFKVLPNDQMASR